MNRRTFLWTVTQVLVGGMVTALLPRLAGAATKTNSPAHILKSAPNGQVLESVDGGLNWRVCADFGSAMVIQSVTQSNDQFLLQADFQGLPLSLKSRDGSTWYTSEWSPPAGLAHKTFLTWMGG